MGIRRSKQEKVYELNIDHIFHYDPLIITNEFLFQTLNGHKFNKATILLPCEHLEILEKDQIRISTQSDYAHDNSLVQEIMSKRDYLHNLLTEFQESTYLEFAIASSYGISQYTPKQGLADFYNENFNSKKPQILALNSDVISNPQNAFDITQIKTQEELSRFQTNNFPRIQYFSIGTLVQKNPQINPPTQNEITNMALNFINSNLRNRESLEFKLPL